MGVKIQGVKERNLSEKLSNRGYPSSTEGISQNTTTKTENIDIINLSDKGYPSSRDGTT